MDEKGSGDRGPNANTAYIAVAFAGVIGAMLVAMFGGRFNSGWPLAAMVSAPAVMAIAIAFVISRSR